MFSTNFFSALYQPLFQKFRSLFLPLESWNYICNKYFLVSIIDINCILSSRGPGDFFSNQNKWI